MNAVIKTFKDDNGKLAVFLNGELDHHSAKTVRTEIDIAISNKQPKELYLDFAGITFMDSSGIGLVMGRYKVMSEYGGKLYITNAVGSIRRVMQVAGMTKLAKITDIDFADELFEQEKGSCENEKVEENIK